MTTPAEFEVIMLRRVLADVHILAAGSAGPYEKGLNLERMDPRLEGALLGWDIEDQARGDIQ